MARGIVCALAGGVCWGFSGTCAQLLMNDYGAPAEWITCVRMVIAAVFFLFLTAVRDWRDLVAVFRDRRSLVQIALFAVFGVLLTQMSYLNAIRYTSAGVGTTIEQIGLVLIMLYVCVRARRLPRVREALGLACALGGMLLIATQGDPSALSLPLPGLVWGIANGLSVAFYIMYPKKLFAEWGSFAVTGIGMFIGGIVAAAVYFGGVALGEPLALPALDAAGAAVFAAFVLVGTFAAFALYLHGVSVVGSVQGSLLGAVEPVSATLFATLWLGTAFTGADLAGCALMIAMIFLVTGEKPNVRQDGAQVVEESHSAKS